jgi:Cu/Zn superoxide dismutase
MKRTTRVAAGIVSVVAVGAVLLATGAMAEEAGTESVQLTPSRNSGVSGTAVFEEAEDGVEVRLSVRGLPEAGVKHINHIHGGATCADDRAGRGAPATIPLKTLVADEDGGAEATTVLKDVTTAQLFDTEKERYVLVHTEAKKGGGIPPGISCADLVPSAGGGPGSGVATDEQAPVKVMPDTGGLRVADLSLLGAAVLALLALLAGRSLKGSI